MALSNYTPKAVIDAGTPADKILAMMTDLLDGSPPSIQVGAVWVTACPFRMVPRVHVGCFGEGRGRRMGFLSRGMRVRMGRTAGHSSMPFSGALTTGHP